MTTRTVHMCLSVRGALNWDKRTARRNFGWIKREDGSAWTVEDFREALMDELAQGHEVIPMAPEPCEGFDYKTGCPGHFARIPPSHVAAEPPDAPVTFGAEPPAKSKASIDCESMAPKETKR